MPIKQCWQVPANTSGQTVISFIRSKNPELDKGQVFKALKNKDIKLNGTRIKADKSLSSGDVLTCFWPDNLADRLFDPRRSAENGQNAERFYHLVYSDDDLIIVNKAAGVSVHADKYSRNGDPDLLHIIRSNMQDNMIELCHRLDRNTSGLIMLSRNHKTNKLITDLLRKHSIRKKYHCLAKGLPPGSPAETNWQTLTGWLEKDADSSNVYIHDRKKQGDLRVETKYRLLKYWPDLGPDGSGISHLEIELITGRTHQIRAHLASIGCPLLGDGKYGRNSFNRHFTNKLGHAIKRQQLTATEIIMPNSEIMRETARKPLDENTEALIARLADMNFRIEPDFDIKL